MSDLSYFDSGDGIYSVPEEGQAHAVKLGWKPVAAPSAAPAAEAPDTTMGQGLASSAVKGFVGLGAAIPRAAVGVADLAGVPRNDWTDSLSNLGENAIGALGEVFGGKGGGEKAIEAHKQFATEHPVASTAAEIAGSLPAFGASGLAAMGGASTAATVAGGAAQGATLSLADATTAAREQDSTLTFQHALAAVGLGALFGGTLNFAGKKAGDFFASKAARAAEAEVAAPSPNLDLPPEPFPLDVPGAPGAPAPQTSFGTGGLPPEVPDLATPGGPRTVPAPPLPREAELFAEKEATLGARGEEGMGLRGPPPGGAPEMPTIPAPATSNAEVMGGRPPSAAELTIGGRTEPVDAASLATGGKAGEVNPEDMSRAMWLDNQRANQRSAKVDKILAKIPEGGIHPDWVLSMTDTQKAALIDLADVAQPRDTAAADRLWQALADAVSEREGIALSPAMKETTDELEGQLRKSLADKVGAPRAGTMLPPAPAEAPQVLGPPDIQAPTPGTFQGPEISPVPAPNYGPPTEGTFPAPGGFQGPEISPAAMAGEADVIGAPRVPLDVDGPAPAKWTALLTRLAKHTAARFSGKLVGGVLGGTHGPAGALMGLAAGEAVDRLLATSAAQRMATRGAARLENAVSGGLSGTRKGVERASPFMAGAKTPEAAFKVKAAELEALAADPTLIVDKVAKAFGPIEDTAGIQAVLETAQRGIQYLISKMPAHGPDPTSLTPHLDQIEPERSEISRFARIHDTIWHPETAVADIKNGTVVPDQIEALRAVYPPVLDKAAQHTVSALVARKQPLWASERATASMILDAHSGIDSPEFAQKYGPGFASYGAPPEDSKKAPGGAGRRLGHKSQAAAAYGTGTTSQLTPTQ